MRSLGRSFNAYQKMPSVVENRGPTRMQMPATVPVCADEPIKQTTVYPANLRRQNAADRSSGLSWDLYARGHVVGVL